MKRGTKPKISEEKIKIIIEGFKELWNPQEIANRANISKNTLYVWIKKGREQYLENILDNVKEHNVFAIFYKRIRKYLYDEYMRKECEEEYEQRAKKFNIRKNSFSDLLTGYYHKEPL